MNESKEKRVKVAIWIPPSLRDAMLHEGVDRRLSLGEIIEEAMKLRLQPFGRGPEKK